MMNEESLTYPKPTPRAMLSMLCVILLVVATVASSPAGAKKQTLKLASPKARSERVMPSHQMWVEADSLTLEELGPKIGFSGFDKPHNSRKESFLLSNNSDRYIAGVKVKIEYFDMQGRMIDSREATVEKGVPSGETRLVTLPAVDPHSTLYYYNSKAPRRGGQPFKVKMTLQSVLLPK